MENTIKIAGKKTQQRRGGRTWLALLVAGIGAVGSPLSGQNTAAGRTLFARTPMALPKNVSLPVVLPYREWKGLIALDGIIAGRAGVERFALATGLNANTVTPATYARLQLQALPSQVRFDALDVSREATEVRVQNLQFGALHLDAFPAALVDVFGALSRENRPDAPTGWLGAPFLAAFQVTFDFGSHTVLLESAQAKLPADPSAIVVPITLRDGRPYTQVSVGTAKSFNALVDTGSLGTLIPGAVAERLKIKPLQILAIARGPGKEGKAAIAIAPTLRVGKAERRAARVVFYAPNAAGEYDSTLAVLGLDFLRRYKVTFNYARQKMALTPLTLPKPPDPAKPEPSGE